MTSGNNIESEFLELSSKNEWQVLYQRIRAQSYVDKCSEAIKPQNKILNRYRDVSPYDHSRIILNRGSTDYINANLIKVDRANRQYILTQGPLSNTFSHFWLMVWEQETKAIVMLNKLVEKKQDKCFQYWPAKIGPNHIMNLEDVGLTVEYIEQQDHSYYLTRILRLTDTESGKFRDILQFHYITWPDFGVPTSPTVFLEFLRKVRDAGVLEANVGPAVVHCSAGIGRSGTFCLVDSCLILIEKYGINAVDVKEILLEMRKFRMGLIQTPEQLRFSYQAIIEGAKQLLHHDKSISQKENFVNISIKLDPSNAPEHIIDSEEDEPPPLPPRNESLPNGTSLDRPLPNIPTSVSDNDLTYDDDNETTSYIPSGPLPVVPADEDECSEEDELEDEEQESTMRSDSPASEKLDEIEPEKAELRESGDTLLIGPNHSLSYEVRQRNRAQRKETMESQVRDMKRRQQINEQWTRLKRSLYLPLVVGGSLLLGGGLIAYIYYRD